MPSAYEKQRQLDQDYVRARIDKVGPVDFDRFCAMININSGLSKNFTKKFILDLIDLDFVRREEKNGRIIITSEEWLHNEKLAESERRRLKEETAPSVVPSLKEAEAEADRILKR